MSDEKKKLVVLGGGPGGYPAAFYAADLGYDVTLIDVNENPGGVCLHVGCIPSKALLHMAKLINETKDAAEHGVSFGTPDVDLDKLRDWKDSVIKRLVGGLGQMRNLRKVTGVQGYGRFKDDHTIEVDKEDGSTEEISFDFAIVAAGSSPTRLPFLDYEDDRVMDSTGALELKDIPGKLLVLGGGYIGLEMGSVYAALGSKVSVVEMLDRILPGADKDLVQPLKKKLDNEFEEIMVSTKVTEVKGQKNGLKVSFEDKDGETFDKIYDRVLVSVGRRPNTKDIGLDEAGVEVDDKGFITVDGQRRTSKDHIFAIGDIAGEPMLAHKATHEASVAVEAIDGKKTEFEPRAIPAVVFTDPEIAWTGVTEAEAKEQGLDYKVAKFPWAALGRATTLERNDGVTKLIVDAETERILGVGITGVNAGDMIAEGTLAIEMAANVEDLKLTIHPHPTLSESLMEAAEVFFGHSPHFKAR